MSVREKNLKDTRENAKVPVKKSWAENLNFRFKCLFIDITNEISHQVQ